MIAEDDHGRRPWVRAARRNPINRLFVLIAAKDPLTVRIDPD